MRIFWLSILLIFIVLSCEKDRINKKNPGYLILDNTSIILKAQNVEDLTTHLNNNQLIKDVSQLKFLQELKPQLNILQALNHPQNIVITLGRTELDSSIISIILPFKDSIFKLDSLKNTSQEIFKSKDQTLFKTTLDDQIFYSQKVDSYFYISKNLEVVKEAKNHDNHSSKFTELLEKTNNEKLFSIIYKNQDLDLERFMVDGNEKLDIAFSEISLLDLEISKNDFKFNGITKSNDSSKTWLSVFKNTIPQDLKLPTLAPADASLFKTLSYDSFDIFYSNLNKLKGNLSESRVRLFQNSTEAAVFKNASDKEAFLFHIIDAQNTIENFEGLNAISEYRSVPIYEFEIDSITGTTFTPFLNLENTKYLTTIDDFIVIGKDIGTIESVIANFQNGSVLSEYPAYKDLMSSMTDESSLFAYVSKDALKPIIGDKSEDSLRISILEKSSLGLQYVIDDGFVHVNGFITNSSSNGQVQGVSEEFSLNLDNELMTEPQFVKNYSNSQMDILVQDIANVLYLVSNDGKVLWKKTLDGKILGRVSQMDINRNGRLQLVFATKNRVYLLDSKGNNIGKFPLTFKDNITQPLSVFDYDGKKKYRLLVTQGSQLLIYDKKGSIVKGFNFKSSGSTISSQPKHFRVSGKDYIVFSQGNKLEVLSRTGKTRINVKEKLNFSKNGIYLYENRFTSTSTNGELLEVGTNGRVKRENLKLEDNHQIDATSKTLVTLSNNVLNIRKSLVELPFGDYTRPQIFYINDKIYVSVTDLQAKKVYLFDSLAKLIPNFPVYGNSSAELGDIDKDAALELVTKGNDDAIIVYEIN